MFGSRSSRSKPSDQEIIRVLRTEVNRLICLLAKSAVIDPQTGEERSAVEMLKDAQYWKGVSMQLGHHVDGLEKDVARLEAELSDLRSAQAGPDPEECASCGYEKVVYYNALGKGLCSACCEGCPSDCREAHTYAGACMLAVSIRWGDTEREYADSVEAAQREHDIVPDPVTVSIPVVKPLWERGAQQP